MRYNSPTLEDQYGYAWDVIILRSALLPLPVIFVASPDDAAAVRNVPLAKGEGDNIFHRKQIPTVS